MGPGLAGIGRHWSACPGKGGTLISVVALGLVDYGAGVRLQHRLVELRKRQAIGDVLLFLEHAPVITLGRNARAENVLASRQQLADRGVEVFECDRGGDVTFHGPGQLVGYPIFDLYNFASSTPGKRLGVIEYVRRVEEVLIRTCADFHIAGERITGVWTREEPGTAGSPHNPSPALEPAAARAATSHDFPARAKIAAIGVHISRGVTSHGFALNVTNDLGFFDLIIPCGISSKTVTSMAAQLHRPLAQDEVAHSVSRHFGQVFESQMLWLDSLAALLGEAVGVPLITPAELRRLRGEDEICPS
jgi:lipoyl(octanoyl) transferase